MEESYDREFWQFSDQLRLQNNFSNLSIADSIWSSANANSFAAGRRNAADALIYPDHTNNSNASAVSSWKNNSTSSPGLIGSGKLAFGSATTTNADRYNNFPGAAPDAKNSSFGFNSKNATNAAVSGNDYYFNKSAAGGFNNNNASAGGDLVKSYFNKSVGRPANNNDSNNNNFSFGDRKIKNGSGVHDKKKNAAGAHGSSNGSSTGGVDKRFKSLPAAEALPRGEAVGGYIFVCNNDTMEENLKRQLFGLPSRYRDSVRAIRPGLPLFLYNYSTHQLHGIFEATSFGGSNIDPTAWGDKKCPGESRFPAQVKVATRKICDPLEEDAFRPILHHYDGPKFRLELSVPEALSLLDIFAEKVFA